MGRRSNISRRLIVEGVDEVKAALKDLSTTDLQMIVEEVMTEAMEPVRLGLLSQFADYKGVHDAQKATSSGKWNRWRFKNSSASGKTPGFTRAQVRRAFSIKGFGFRFWVDKQLNYRARVKAWAPGIWLAEGGRYMGLASYPGWRVIFRLYKSMTRQMNAHLATEIPRRVTQASARRGLA